MQQSTLTSTETRTGSTAAPSRGLAAGADVRGVLRRGLCAAASLRLTLALLFLLLVCVVWTYSHREQGTWPLVVPLALVGANLLAAIAVHPTFRRDAPLLMFHVALLAIAVLVGLGRLTYLRGHMELSQGEWFQGTLAGFEAGPWHPWAIREVRFANEGFSIDYLPGRQRDHTRNTVRYADASGTPQALEIGDQVPLVLDGYSFYTSHNKGFALAFRWEPRGGAAQRGTVHLPAYPSHEYQQANTWMPPGASDEVWVQLQFDEPLLDPSGPARFRTPGSHKVVLRTSERRVELTPGAAVDITGGRLVYEGIGTWMGYRVFYDRTLPWLLAACVVAVLSLAWHFWRKVLAHPWTGGFAEARVDA